MKKFNIDKILLCFGIFFVSIFGVGMIDSFAYDEESSKEELQSLTSSYPYYFTYEKSQDQPYNRQKLYYTYYVLTKTKDVFFPNLESGQLCNSKGETLVYGTDYTTFYTVLFDYYDESKTDKTIYYKNHNVFGVSFTDGSGTYNVVNLLKSSNFDIKTIDGKVVFQNNPLKEVKQVGEAVKNQTKVILPIAIFLMGCLLLVQILRRVLVRFSIG